MYYICIYNIKLNNTETKRRFLVFLEGESAKPGKLNSHPSFKGKKCLTSSWNAANGCRLQPSDPLLLDGPNSMVSPRICFTYPRPFPLKASSLDHKTHPWERCHLYSTKASVLLCDFRARPNPHPHMFTSVILPRPVILNLEVEQPFHRTV